MDSTQSPHTIVLSDIHLSEAEPPHPNNPNWKRFKRREYFVDHQFYTFIRYLMNTIPSPIELVLNGDIFDFDSVMTPPPEGRFSLSWLERRRGLNAEEAKSRFKLRRIMEDHDTWMQSIREFLLQGNQVVFIIGNHDIEFHWLSLREDFIDYLGLPTEYRNRIRFCEWFYISHKDTLIEHGNQYDAYSLCTNPIHPLIRKGQKVLVRVPFGNQAGKYILNGMGLFNPHAESSFIKESFLDYIRFYTKYIMRVQPFILWTWFWGAIVTLVTSVTEGLLPALNDPLTAQKRVEDIAQRSNCSPTLVWTLRELHAHAAVFNPIKVARELWLDRALLFLFLIWVSFNFFSIMNLFTPTSFSWFLIVSALLMPFFIFYARSVRSEVAAMQQEAMNRLPLAARLASVQRIIQGHTHIERHLSTQGVEYLNTGTWSNAYKDVECTVLEGRKCFAWIRPTPEGRVASLHEWTPRGAIELPKERGSKRTPAEIKQLRKRIRASLRASHRK